MQALIVAKYTDALTRCSCPCHHYSGIANPDSVDVTDVLDAAVACPKCINLHCPALLDRPNVAPFPEMSVWDDTRDDTPVDDGN